MSAKAKTPPAGRKESSVSVRGARRAADKAGAAGGSAGAENAGPALPNIPLLAPGAHKIDTPVAVYVRVRPFSESEKTRDARCAVQADDEINVVTATHPALKQKKTFAFDRTFFIRPGQEDVYQDVGNSMLQRALEGYNTALLTLGQCASGKTHSVFGSDKEPGLVPRFARDLYRITGAANTAHSYSVAVAFFEVHSDTVRDLMVVDDRGRSRVLKVVNHKGEPPRPEGLSFLPVYSESDIRKVLKSGRRRATTAQTLRNAESSRSHLFFQIRVEQKDSANADALVVTSVSTFVDVAGGQDSASMAGARLKEQSVINQNLGAYRNLLRTLAANKRTAAPAFRDCKLTALLQGFLAGNTCTAVLCTVSPADLSYEESQAVLRDAELCRKITTHPERNVVQEGDDVARGGTPASARKPAASGDLPSWREFEAREPAGEDLGGAFSVVHFRTMEQTPRAIARQPTSAKSR